MARGGARPNSGPKPTISRAETTKLIQKAADDGVLPLEVMLDNLRFYTKEAKVLIATLLESGVSEEGDEPNEGMVKAIGDILMLRKLAGEQAAQAAPYCHARQGIVVEEAAGSDFMPLAERIAAYTRAGDVALTENKVVELKPRE